MRPTILKFLLLAAVFILVDACRIKYTFTGTTVPTDIKTITIEQFENTAPLISPGLAQDFSETLRDYFLRRTNFKVVANNGDIIIKGAINNYAVKQTSLAGNTSEATQNRLTITIKAKLESEKHPELNWEDNFSNFADFGGAEDLSSVEKSLQTLINEKIAQDIFNKTFGRW